MVYSRPMRTSDAIAHFGTKAAIARTLHISHVAVNKWGDVIPMTSAKALEIHTSGVLRVDWSLYESTRRALLERQEFPPVVQSS